MLVLTGEAGQRLTLNHSVVIEVLEVTEDSVQIGIELPPGTDVRGVGPLGWEVEEESSNQPTGECAALR
jgi:hypothetical protein